MKHFLMILFLVSPVVNNHFDELTKEYFSNMYFLDIFPVDKLCCVGLLVIGATGTVDQWNRQDELCDVDSWMI